MAWLYSRKITINKDKVSNTTLSNFPVKIAGIIPELANTASTGRVHNSSGYDIAFFSDALLTTPLKFERVVYDSTNGKHVFYVKIPTLSTSVDTIVYMGYGSASLAVDPQDAVNVWDSNYKAVYHFGNSSSFALTDSTGNGNTLLNTGSVANTSGPNHQGAAYFSGTTSSNLQLDNFTSVTVEPMTFEAMHNPPDGNNVGVIVGFASNASSTGGRNLARAAFSASIFFHRTAHLGSVTVTVNQTGSAGQYITGSWNYAAGTWASTSSRAIHPNGVTKSENTSSSTTLATPNRLTIGAGQASSTPFSFFTGSIAEVRISDIVRSDDWIKTTYNNLMLSSSFFAISGEGRTWEYYRPITIDYTKVSNTNQTNFPIKVAGTLTYLASGSLGGKIYNSNGYDIAFFSDSALTTPLKFERVVYDSTNGKHVFYVNIPTLSASTNTTIYMAYGNATIATDTQDITNTWDSNYKAVYHFGNSSSLSLSDSTVNANTLTNTGSVPVVTGFDGQGAASFNGTTRGLIRNSVVVSTMPYTFESVFLPATLANAGALVAVAVSNSLTGSTYLMKHNDGAPGTPVPLNLRQQGVTRLVDVQRLNSYSTGSWGYAAAVFASTSSRDIHANGAAKTGSVTTAGVVTAADRFSIGTLMQNGGYAQFFSGSITEVRVSDIVRSDDWIKTTYNTIMSASFFYAVGEEVGVYKVTVRQYPRSIAQIQSSYY